VVKRRLVIIEILPTAKADLNDIYQYIAKDSVKYAKIEKQLIIEAIEQLYTFPDSGVPFNHRNIEVRRLAFRNYLSFIVTKHNSCLRCLPSIITLAIYLTIRLFDYCLIEISSAFIRKSIAQKRMYSIFYRMLFWDLSRTKICTGNFVIFIKRKNLC